jgi:hypothetical protein
MKSGMEQADIYCTARVIPDLMAKEGEKTLIIL